MTNTYKQKLNLVNKISIFSFILIIFFICWLKADFIFYELGEVKVPLNTFLDSYIVVNKIEISDKLLTKIKGFNPKLQPFFLQIYFKRIPVNKHWSKLYDYKEKSGLLLVDYYQAQHNYQKAREFLLDLIHINSNDYVLWNYLGENYELENNFTMAVDSYLKVLDLNSNYYPSIDNLANIFYMRGEYIKFLSVVNSYLESPAFSKLCIFWKNQEPISENQKVCEPVIIDNSFHHYQVMLNNNSSWKKELVLEELRIDPVQVIFPLEFSIINSSFTSKSFSNQILTTTNITTFNDKDIIGFVHSADIYVNNESLSVTGQDPFFIFTPNLPQKYSNYYVEFDLIVKKKLDQDLADKYFKVSNILSSNEK